MEKAKKLLKTYFSPVFFTLLVYSVIFSPAVYASREDDFRNMEKYLYEIGNNPRDESVYNRVFPKVEKIYKDLTGRGIYTSDAVDSPRFYANIRNIYEGMKRSAEYDKAIAILNCLISIEERTDYYKELGNLYMYGLNEPSEAIKNYDRALEIGYEDNRVYTDLGLAYELSGDYTDAVFHYEKAAHIAPADNWAQYGMHRVKGIELAGDGQMIKDWLFFGPAGLEEKAIPEIDDKWIRKYEYSDYGYVNLQDVFGPNSFVKGYALTYLYSPDDRKIIARMGSDDGIDLWINGKKVWSNPAKRPAFPDNDRVKIYIKKGWNTVLLEITQDWGGWGFYFRVTGLSNERLDEILFDPLRDEKRKDEICRLRAEELFVSNMRKKAGRLIYCMVILLLIIVIVLALVRNYKTKKVHEDFIAGLTHDLKGPLSSIMISAEMLMDGRVKSPEKQEEYYTAIDNESRKLYVYINRILDFLRSGKKKKAYSAERIDMVSLVRKTVDMYKDENRPCGVDIDLKIKEGELFTRVDETAFVQVLMNLLNNADKYSPDNKKVEVAVSWDLDRRKAVITVRDNGIGLTRKEIKKIFRKFYRGEKAVSMDIPGTGLGLTFVRNIIRYYNGRIFVESSPGKGTVFTIEMPLDIVR